MNSIETDLDLYALDEGLDLEKLPEANSLSSWATTSTVSTAGCPISSAGCVGTATG